MLKISKRLKKYLYSLKINIKSTYYFVTIGYQHPNVPPTNGYDILLFVKDSNSFIGLLDEQKWSEQIGNENFTFPSSPSIPPELSLIIKNVDQTRIQILSSGKINVNYRSYDVEEYIAPVSVLICSKCCGIGHFKRQCIQSNETCRTCGQSFPDLRGRCPHPNIP
jgi:hypothetical protein